MYPNQGFDYDSTQSYYDVDQAYYDSNQAYSEPYLDQYYEYDEPQEDIEAAEVSMDQEGKDRLEALESNRLYLKKIRKQCAVEDFVDLDQKQLFLFEIIIEYLEVNSESVLGLTPSGENTKVNVTARAQFLNSPYLDISETNKSLGVSNSVGSDQNYFQTIGSTRHSNITKTSSAQSQNHLHSSLGEKEGAAGSTVTFDVKWTNGYGKSCLFSMTALEMILNLDKYPVNIHVNRCVGQVGDGTAETSEPLGYTSIRLPDEFGMSVLHSLQSGVILPVTNVHRQPCDIRNVFGAKKGFMEVLIRLSAFGPVIITSVESIGRDRHYYFHPGPLSSKDDEREHKTPRSELLKPLVTEEENTIGVSLMKELDSFQKPVVWRLDSQNYDCLNLSCSNGSNSLCSEFDSPSLVMPFSSEINLCRNVQSPTDQTILKKFREDICDWHNLVCLEIKNNPECCCDCLVKRSNSCKNLSKKLKDGRKPYQPMPPIIGLGFTPDPINCKCPCPEIRNCLTSKTTSFKK